MGSPLDQSKGGGTGSEFLIPLRLLRDHTTGGQWPIRISFRHGPLYRIATPQTATTCDPAAQVPPATSDPAPGRTGTLNSAGSHAAGVRLSPKHLIRVRATDASDLLPSLWSASVNTMSGDENQPPFVPHDKTRAAAPSTLLSDDASVNSDVSESIVGQSASRGVVQSKVSEDQDDREGGTMSAEDYFNDEPEGEDESGAVDEDEDSGDEDTHLKMIAGLATSSLLTSNVMDSVTGLSSLRQASNLVKSDELGVKAAPLGGNLQKQTVTNWESSFVLATGSNNGQVIPLSLPSPPSFAVTDPL
jgi:hypothetical protein